MSHPGPTQQRLHRRAFHRRAAQAGAAGLLAGCWSTCGRIPALRAAEAAKAFPAGRYVDVHTHIGTMKSGKNPPMTAEALLRWMDASDVAQAVVLPLVSPESFYNPVPSEYALEQTKPYRDRLIPFCSVDPRNSWARGKKLVDTLKSYIDQGAKGFGEHKPGVKIDDEGNMGLYEACDRVELPVLFHLDNKRNMDTPGLPGLEKVLKAFPRVAFIGHGPGWWASISGSVTQADLGGYPRGEVIAGGAIDTLMDKYPNLYGDLSAGSGVNAIARDTQFGRQFLIRRADRLMFGTDYLSIGQQIRQLELYRQVELPAEVQAKIFRDNARKLLKLS